MSGQARTSCSTAHQCLPLALLIALSGVATVGASKTVLRRLPPVESPAEFDDQAAPLLRRLPSVDVLDPVADELRRLPPVAVHDVASQATTIRSPEPICRPSDAPPRDVGGAAATIPPPEPICRPSDAALRDVGGEDLAPGPALPMPPQFEPWWAEGVVQTQLEQGTTLPVGLHSLIAGALSYSPQISAESYLPLAEEARVIESDAEFDLTAFMESTFDRPSDPVGDELTTGGPPRFRQEDWTYSAGMRKKTVRGGALEISQQIGYRSNNSLFFSPPRQGNSRLVLSFTQPLLRGAGESYNTSRTVLAQIDSAMAWDQFCARLQDHLLQVTRAYWQLYEDRATLLQQRWLYEEAETILSELEGRRAIDAAQSQVVRARAAVAARRSDLDRAKQNIRNAEARIRQLVADPELIHGPARELVPLEHPAERFVDVPISDARRSALDHRPEMQEAIKAVQAAAVRLDVSRNDLLPALDLVLEGYVAGLEGNVDIAQAFGDQFSVGEPGYTVGLKYEVPLGRRGPQANLQRRQLELCHLTKQLDATALSVLTEVDIAVGEVVTTHREIQGKYQAMRAAEEDVNYLEQRWRMLPGEDRSASLVLQDLLDAQNRLALEQHSFTRAQIGYTMALVELKRATGTLLQHEEVTIQRACQDGTPSLILQKTDVQPQAVEPQASR